MAISSPPILSPLLLNTKSNFGSLSPPSIPLVDICSRPTNKLSSALVVLCYKSGNGLASEEKRILLERYGYDADEFLSQASPKFKKKKEQPKTRRGQSDLPEDPKPARTTHKLLQVLGGKARRKKLISPKGMDVRPMMEVVKGAAFDILQAAGGCPASLRPGRWLDLYSGTGSVGIEALSRGCSEVHFVEMDPWVVSDVLRPNLEQTEFLDASVIHTVRVENFLERAEKFVGDSSPFDYISVTPPYTQVDYGVLMRQISESLLIGEDTFIVVEYPSRTVMLDSCGSLVKLLMLSFYHIGIQAMVTTRIGQQTNPFDNSSNNPPQNQNLSELDYLAIIASRLETLDLLKEKVEMLEASAFTKVKKMREDYHRCYYEEEKSEDEHDDADAADFVAPKLNLQNSMEVILEDGF